MINRPARTQPLALQWLVLWSIALLGVAIASVGTAAIIDEVEVDLTYFSPNGDGVQDNVTFTYSLSESATVWLDVVAKDSVTVVRTLVDGSIGEPGVDYDVVWDGMTSIGVLAPEDSFLVFTRATSTAGTEADTVFSRHFILDVTVPSVFVTDISPEIFAPGSLDPPTHDTLYVEYQIQDPPPSEEVAVQVVIFDQTPSEVATLRNEFVPAIGSYEDSWDGSGTTLDGDHTAEVFVRDEAGNEARAARTFDVSLDGPTIVVTSLESGVVLPDLPDSLYGWAWHRHGVHDSLWTRFSTATNVNEPWVRVMTTYFRSDTLFFSSTLKTVVEEQEVKYTISFRGKNLLGQDRTSSIDVTWDQTPPPPPVLEQPEPVTHSPNFVLNGTIDPSVGFEDVMSIYRNDVLADTINPAVPGQWPHSMTLVGGLNRIYAVITDKAGNVGQPSNTIEVTWDQSMGFHIPQPFRPDDAFQITVDEGVTTQATIRIYDLGGNLVQTLSETGFDSTISVPWNGLNGDGVLAKKGPLVAVAQLRFDNGKSELHRKVFAFAP
ncbi:MAG: hypothetical protein JSW50_16795 [Candidatus Latescibacterota bacterium]|nr:MAG: hypothetical protein JSW50_16795 [Candidatus Latescibacterota bacterium]